MAKEGHARQARREPVGRERATCVLVGGPVDGGGTRNLPMLVPGLAPDYLDVVLTADRDNPPSAIYRRVAPAPELRPGVGRVWRYEYDEEATLDPTCIGTR